MTTNNVTASRGYQLPFSTNSLDEDVLRLIAAITAIDADVATALAGLLTKSSTGHGHVINDIAGLQGALDGKADAGDAVSLASLSDVDVAGAAAGQFLRLIGTKWSPAAFDAGMIASGVVAAARLPSHLTTTALSAAYAAVVHGHAISDVVGLQGALDGKTSFPSGTRLLFQQTSAPTGWTKDTTHNEKALRIVSGSVGSGGSVAFTTAFSNRTISGNVANTTAGGTVGDTALTVAQIPAHDHFAFSSTRITNTGAANVSASNYGARVLDDGSASPNYEIKGSATVASVGLTSQTGSGETHTHTFTGAAHNHSYSTTLNMAVAYVDVIIAQKD